MTTPERQWEDFKAEALGRADVDIDLLAIEREAQERLQAMGREFMAEAMKRADTASPEVEIDGARWGSRRETPGEYCTVFGWIEVRRSVYQQSGRGRVAIPMDLRTGVVEGSYTPRMARIITHATAVMTDEEAADFLAEVGAAVVSKPTISRVSRAMGARYERNRPVIESAVRAHETIPAEAVTVQVGVDGVMVPQDGEHAKARGRNTPNPEPPRHETHYGPVGAGAPADTDGEGGRAWHEGAVGTVAYFNAAGERLHTVYHARMPEPHKATLIASLGDELTEILAERPALNVVFASDGARGQWASLNKLAAALPANFTGHTMHLVDAFHVAEYVQKGADAIAGANTSEARILSVTWRETNKEAGGPERVLRSMRAKLSSVVTPARRNVVRRSIGYLDRQNKAGRMDYAGAVARNYPIGTGITEAAAKTVVGTRMKKAGARFSQHGGQTVMLFRAALLSDRFKALHRELGASYMKTVRIAA